MKRTEEWKPPESFREFLREITGTWRTVRYAFELSDSPDVRPWLYKKYAFSIVMVLLTMAQPKLVAFVFQGVVEREDALIAIGCAGIAALMLSREVWSFLYWRAHEHLFGRALRNLNRRIAESFFAKSPGQHRHIKTLNYESIQKRNRQTNQIFPGSFFN